MEERHEIVRETLEYAPVPLARPKRPWALVGIGLTAILAGLVVGASTNAVNGAVSARYFVLVMGWDFVPSVWWSSVVQGILEGGVVGLMFSIVLTTTIGIVTRATCTYGMGTRWLGWIVLGIYGMWVAGGIGGVMLAAWLPDWYRRYFIEIGGDRGENLRCAWVGGSIVGAEIGGFLVLAVGLVWFGVRWSRMLRREVGAGV
jgi:hypothetical protein